MKKDLTELVFILDKSGSMHGLEDDTIGGFNSTLEEQRSKAGEVYVSTILFSNDSLVLHDRVAIDGISPMTRDDYRTGGSTALVDAVGDAIHHIGNVHKYARDEDRPEHTLFVIITDGMENASHKYSAADLRKKIERQKEKYGWEFLFLGANMDAVETARHYGIAESRAASFHNDSMGYMANYKGVSKFMDCLRSKGRVDAEDACWSEEIRADYAARKK